MSKYLHILKALTIFSELIKSIVQHLVYLLKDFPNE